MRGALLLTALALGAPPLAAADTPAQQPYVEVRPEGAGWRVTYRLPHPTASLRFERPASFYRERVWRVVTPGYRFRRDGDLQVLALEPGRPASDSIVIDFPVHTEVIPLEYELFQAFTDGGVALYTGHLYANAIPIDGRPSGMIRVIAFEPPPGGQVMIEGRVLPPGGRWTDPRAVGTYAYFGTTRPVETDQVLAIVDRGTPPWIRRQLETQVPWVFAALEQRLGVGLAERPVLLFAMADGGPAYEWRGGALPALIQLTLVGRAWRDSSATAQEQVFHFIAHEAAHLWNGMLVRSPAGGASWLHEGSADAMADELLLAAGIIDQTRFRERQADALTSCALALTGGTIREAHRQGGGRAFYSCGQVLALWGAKAAERMRATADLFSIWRGLIAVALVADSTYDEARYFRVLSDLGVSAYTSHQMDRFLSTPRSWDLALAGLRRAGVEIRAGEGIPSVAYRVELARLAIGHLMASRCDGRYSVRVAPDRVHTGAIAGCPGFERALEVTLLEGLPILEDGAGAYDAMAARCRARRPVTLTVAGQAEGVEVACAAALPERPPWFEWR